MKCFVLSVFCLIGAVQRIKKFTKGVGTVCATIFTACLPSLSANFSVIKQTNEFKAGLLSKEQKAKVMEINLECMKESGVDEAIALKAQNGEYIDDPKLKKHLFCFTKKTGFQNEAGELQVDYTKTMIRKLVKDADVDAMVDKCNIKKETAEETAFAVVKCFHDMAPTKDFLGM